MVRTAVSSGRLRHREGLGDHLGELESLAGMEIQQHRRLRREQAERDAGQRVEVDVDALAIAGRGVPGMGERRAGLLLGQRGDLEVDQDEPVVDAEQHVVRMQVAEDHAAAVQLSDRGFDPATMAVAHSAYSASSASVASGWVSG